MGPNKNNDHMQTYVHFDAANTGPLAQKTDLINLPEMNDALIGQTFQEKYLIEQKLGNGGMGVVYRARHILMDRLVAIKLLNSELTANNKALEYFHREARAAGRLQHPNIAAVLDFGPANDSFYLVMEYLEGQTLRDRLREQGILNCSEALQIIREVCQAVATAHSCKIIHRDLKPDNIFLQHKQGQFQVKVLDFGIAKILSEGATSVKESTGMLPTNCDIVGTPHYMSPEQCLNQPLSHLSDIYSIGVIAFELITGNLPFNDRSPFSIVNKHINEQPPSVSDLNPEIPSAVAEVILRAMSKNPNERQPSAAIFEAELKAAWDESTTRKFRRMEYELEGCANTQCQKPHWQDSNYCSNCHTLRIGAVLRKRFRVERFIGAGGFGTTYLVIDHDCLNERRILKDLNLHPHNTNYSDDDRETALRLFKREAEVMSRLRHPGIPTLHTYLSEGENSYLVQDFIPGQTLSEQLKRQGETFSEQAGIKILAELADILDYLHSQNPPIIHRDIKPQNVMRHIDGQIMLIDFGAVYHAANNLGSHPTYIGSPGYAPPEQIMGEAVPQSDIYAAAATIIHLLSGMAPARFFNRETLKLDWQERVTISPEFAMLLSDMLRLTVSERLASAKELRSRLKQLTNRTNNVMTPAESGASVATPITQRFDINVIAAFCYEIENYLNLMSESNYYQILNVEINASEMQIRQSYEQILQRFHPNQHSELIKHNQLLQMQLTRIVERAGEAFITLKSTITREKYDQQLRINIKSNTSSHRRTTGQQPRLERSSQISN